MEITKNFLKNSTNEEFISSFTDLGFEVYVGMDNIEPLFIDTEEDKEMLADIKKHTCEVYLVHSTLARDWWFTSIDTLRKFFLEGNQLSVNKVGFIM